MSGTGTDLVPRTMIGLSDFSHQPLCCPAMRSERAVEFQFSSASATAPHAMKFCKTNEVPAKSAVMKCGLGAGENPFAKVNELITKSSEANHKSNRDDELVKAGEKKVDLETQAAKQSCKVEATVPKSSVLDDKVAELHADLGRVNERKIFATTVEIPQAQHVDKIVDPPVVLRTKH